MGFRNSPFNAIRLMNVAQEIIRGDRRDTTNPFHWIEARTNYPGTPTYTPTLPRVYKYNPITDTIANDIVGFVDDFRGVGASKQDCLRVLHHFASMMQYLGIQDAPRKRRTIGQRQGAWTGSIILAIDGVGLFVKCMDTKWTKTKDIFAKYLSYFNDSSRPIVAFKELEIDVGFLIHMTLTYPIMKPYLHSFYASMNSWRDNRDLDGWKLTGNALIAFYTAMNIPISDQVVSDALKDVKGTPKTVTLIPDFLRHLNALINLFDGDIPALRLIRGKIIGEVGYGFGDASGAGFGASWLDQTTSEVVIRVGVWNKEGLGTSSNFREFRNSVETLEAKGARGELEGVELFFFTDNSVSECVAFKGSTSSPILFDLVLRLNQLEMKYKCIIHLIHIAGTRMIAQGTDGLSRGDLYEGVLRGDSMLDHIPLAQNALERSPRLKEWIVSWSGGLDLDVNFLDETGWFEAGHDIIGARKNCDGRWMPEYKHSIHVWSPPPAGASIAAQQLRQARHKRMNSIHIFVCPRIMTREWEKHIQKSADLIVTIPIGTDYWSNGMHEPLRLALYFPFAKIKPWQLKGSRLLVEVGRRLSEVWKTGEGTEGDILRELLTCSRRMESMPICDLRRVLYGRAKDQFPHLFNGGGESTSMGEIEGE